MKLDIDDQSLAMIAALEQNDQFRVLRRFTPIADYGGLDNVPQSAIKTGAFVDVETTGLTERDKVVELSVVSFQFDQADGQVLGPVGVDTYREDPKVPLTPEIMEITGLTDDMLKGQAINDVEVNAVISNVDLVISHNGLFDRPMLERRLNVFAKRPWACSMLDVPWRTFGCRDLKLVHLMSHFRRMFYDAHRAEDDALAALHLLASPAPSRPGEVEFDLPAPKTFLGHLLDRARTPTARVWAVDAPFDAKDTHLKPRGYRWNPSDGPLTVKKTWYREVPRADLFEEMAWLADHVYQRGDPPIRVEKMTAMRRYSHRPGTLVHAREIATILGDDEAHHGPPSHNEIADDLADQEFRTGQGGT